jgi:N-methylhydantoinase B
MPGIKAIRGWEFDEEILDLITRNVRGSEMRLGDYRAQLAANKIGENRLSALFDEYGTDAVDEYLDELLDYTERRVRAAISDLPDGTYYAEDYMDGDGVVDEPVRLCLTLAVDGDEMTIDFTDTADQNTGPLNCTPAMAFAGAMAVIMALLGEDLPKNDGFYRPFETITPEGSMVNPVDDAPVAAGAEVAVRAAELVLKAMSEALPTDVIAAGKGTICNIAYGGRDPRDDEKYVYYETVAGGYGARAEKDGMEAVQTHFQNTANSPIEELESEIPLYVRKYELIHNSAGAGRTRGGLGVRRDMQFYDHEASFSTLSERLKFPPWGLFSGDDADTARYCIDPDSSETTELRSKQTVSLDPGSIASVQTPGGGGYGDPTERPPEKVLDDVINEKVSVDAAREEYGVVVDREERTIDEEATEQTRAELVETPAANGGKGE